MSRSGFPMHVLSGGCGLLLSMALLGCATTQVHYYTLRSPVPVAHAAAPVPFLIDVLPVGIPADLDLPQLVVRQGENQLVPLDTERWASAPGDEIRGALSSDLSGLLGTRDTAGLIRPKGRALIRVKVQVRRFDAWPGQRVSLVAGWSLTRADTDESALTCFGRFSADVSGGFPEMVQAQRQLIADMAGRIATDARNLAQTGGVAACAN